MWHEAYELKLLFQVTKILISSGLQRKAHINVQIPLNDIQSWAHLLSSWNCQHVNTRYCSSHQNRTRRSKSSKLHTCAQIKTPPPCFLHLAFQSPVPAPTTFSPELTRQDAKNIYQRSWVCVWRVGVTLVTSYSKTVSGNILIFFCDYVQWHDDHLWEKVVRNSPQM